MVNKYSKELVNGQPMIRLSRYERRTARLPHLGDKATGINNGLERLRSTSRTAHKTRRLRLVTK